MATPPLLSRKSLISVLSAVGLLALVLTVLFARGFASDHVIASNDGPLGLIESDAYALPDIFTGGWQDLNTLGYRGGGAWPGFTYGLLYLVGPVMFAKIYPAFALLILGLGAWTFFRCIGLSQVAALLGAMAAALSSTFLSAAAWGVGTHPIAIGMAFFAAAALSGGQKVRRWLRVFVAGFCLGMGVGEGTDVGAIFSIYVAVYAMYQAWQSAGSTVRRLSQGAVVVVTMAVFAALMAAHPINILVGTQIKGIHGTEQDQRTKQERWDWATQWSLPPSETLGFVVPGLFGFRMDTPLSLPDTMQAEYTGGNYWGAAGRDPNWYRWKASGQQGQAPMGFMRFTGGGNYAGVLVILIAAWAVAQSFRRKQSVFDELTRRWIFFWFAVLLVSLLLAYGRFAPFYQILYALPYFSTIRNPSKFTYPVTWAIVILFAYGVNGLWRCYMEGASAGVARGKSWWQRLSAFDQLWVKVMLGLIGASLLGWLIFASNRADFEQYLREVQIEGQLATQVASFAISRVGYFVVLLTVSAGLLALVLSSAFAGHRAKFGALALGIFILFDLGRANQPWVIAWDYAQKYATNPVLEKLKEKPYEQRVAILPFRSPPQYESFDQLYRIEWAQHHFQMYNIHSLDIVQMPRFPQDLLAFEQAMQPASNTEGLHKMTRRWELTSTRYLLGAAGFLDILNEQLDPGKRRFRIAMTFNMVPKPNVANPTRLEHMTVVPAENGQFALFEFTGALPRAGVYSGWQVVTNDAAALSILGSSEFNPHQQVLVAEPITPPAGPASQPVVPAEYVSYKPKHIVLKATAQSPSVLLLNDRYDVNWKVLVDGKPAELLRCNYIMRGVRLPPGEHRVEFHFDPPAAGLYISLAGVLLAIGILGYLAVSRRSEPEKTA